MRVQNTKNVTGEHIVCSEDGKATVWLGSIDDLWGVGKPVGQGGPWKNTEVKANEVSDSYLIAFYDPKELVLSNISKQNLTFTIEVEAVGYGLWMNYKKVRVKVGEDFNYTFPDRFKQNGYVLKRIKIV